MATLAPPLTDLKAATRRKGEGGRGAGRPTDEVEPSASPQDLARADALAGRILALGEPWTQRFCEYLATRVAFDGHVAVSTSPSRSQLAHWLLDRSLEKLALALLKEWVH